MSNISIISTNLKHEVVFEISKNHFYFTDHIVNDTPILPGVFHFFVIKKAVSLIFDDFKVKNFQDVLWLSPITIKEEVLQLKVLLERNLDYIKYEISDMKMQYGRGIVKNSITKYDDRILESYQKTDFETIGNNYIPCEILYNEFSKMGIFYGEKFRCIDKIKVIGNKSYTIIKNRDCLDLVNFLDNVFQSGLAISIGEHTDSLMPFSLGNFNLYEDINFQEKLFYVFTEKKTKFRTNIVITNESKKIIATIIDLGVRPSLL
jgi:hypothetical protein